MPDPEEAKATGQAGGSIGPFGVPTGSRGLMAPPSRGGPPGPRRVPAGQAGTTLQPAPRPKQRCKARPGPRHQAARFMAGRDAVAADEGRPVAGARARSSPGAAQPPPCPSRPGRRRAPERQDAQPGGPQRCRPAGPARGSLQLRVGSAHQGATAAASGRHLVAAGQSRSSRYGAHPTEPLPEPPAPAASAQRRAGGLTWRRGRSLILRHPTAPR